MIDKNIKNKYGHYYYRFDLRLNPDDVLDKKVIDILSQQDNVTRFIKNAILQNSPSFDQEVSNKTATIEEMKEFAEDNFPEFDDDTLSSYKSDTDNQSFDTQTVSHESKKNQTEDKPHVSLDMFYKGND